MRRSAFALPFALALRADAARVLVSESDAASALVSDTDVRPRLSDLAPGKCGPATCDGFDADATCQCRGLDQIALERRAKRLIYNMLQSMRYITDRHASANLLQKMWIPGRKRRAGLYLVSINDMMFVQGAVGAVSGLGEVVSSAMDELSESEDMDVPAGAMPIMVEIWDRKRIVANSFVGEAGAPLAPGRQSYTVPLRPNAARSRATIGGGRSLQEGQRATTVSFDTEVSFSSPRPCATDLAKTCVAVAVSVTCKSAAGLARAGAKRPYCKVLVKQGGDSASSEDRTASIKSSSPAWTSRNEFSYSWETQVAPDERGEDVDREVVLPGLLGSMSVMDQMRAYIKLLFKQLVLGGRECDDFGGRRMNAKQREVCDYFASADRGEVAAVNDAAQPPEVAEAMRRMADRASGDDGRKGSLMEQGSHDGDGDVDDDEEGSLTEQGALDDRRDRRILIEQGAHDDSDDGEEGSLMEQGARDEGHVDDEDEGLMERGARDDSHDDGQEGSLMEQGDRWELRADADHFKKLAGELSRRRFLKRVVVGTGKALWWTVKGVAKLFYLLFRGIFLVFKLIF